MGLASSGDSPVYMGGGGGRGRGRATALITRDYLVFMMGEGEGGGTLD